MEGETLSEAERDQIRAMVARVGPATFLSGVAGELAWLASGDAVAGHQRGLRRVFKSVEAELDEIVKSLMA